MSYKDITAGRKTAKPTAIRFMKSPKTGTRGIEVKFEFLETNGAYESLNWVSWVEAARREGESDQDYVSRSGNVMERTMDTLVHVLGYNGSEETNDEGIFTDPGVINFDGEVSIVVELETYNGKQSPKIKWVNKLNQSAFGSVAKDEVKGALDKLGFKAKFLAAKQQAGAEVVPVAGAIPENEIPF